jgi:peptidoglycan/xylan/chitin deacetylase (PgdA/CDA1 family)
MDVYLNFHGIGTPALTVGHEEKPYWLPLQKLESILELVQQAPSRVHITFDDGNISDVLMAAPALRHAGLSASFFIVSGRIGTPGYLDAGDIRALHADGMRIGSHGAAHVPWTSLPDAALAEQISRSLSVLSGVVDEPVRMVAIPFGAYDSRVLGVLRPLPVDRVFTSDGGPCVPESWLVARNTIRADSALADIRDLVTRQHSPIDHVTARVRQWRRYMR